MNMLFQGKFAMLLKPTPVYVWDEARESTEEEVAAFTHTCWVGP